VTDLFGGPVGGQFHDFAWSLEAPLAPRDIGLRENDLDLAADLAVKAPC